MIISIIGQRLEKEAEILQGESESRGLYPENQMMLSIKQEISLHEKAASNKENRWRKQRTATS
jgi:hypothetical protein